MRLVPLFMFLALSWIAGCAPDPDGGAPPAADAAADATTVDAMSSEPDAGVDAAALEARCDVEAVSQTIMSGPPTMCRVEAPTPFEEASFFQSWVEWGDEGSLLVYWADAERAPGTTVTLPHCGADERCVTVDYFHPSFDGQQRATHGTVRILSADEQRFEVELDGVRFPTAGDIEANGVIGAALTPWVCLVCQ